MPEQAISDEGLDQFHTVVMDIATRLDGECSAEELGQFHRATVDISRQLNRRLDFAEVMRILLDILDGKSSMGALLVPVVEVMLEPSDGGVTNNAFVCEKGAPVVWGESSVKPKLMDYYEPTKSTAIYGHRIATPICLREIMGVAGGMRVVGEKHVFSPFQIEQLMQRQWNGEQGPLLTNGFGNFFFTLDKDGFPVALVVSWGFSDKRWCVEDLPLSHDGVWSMGNRVFFMAPFEL